MPLDVIIAGAGIAGLSSAIGLALNGHSVHVYERRHDNDGEAESIGAIQLQPNAVKILKDWGALRTVDEVTYDSLWTDVREHTGETMVLIDMHARGGTRMGRRGDFKGAMQKYAIECGAQVHRGQQVVHVQDDDSRPVAIFADGSRKAADLIIGADGTNSSVRRSLHPSFQPTVLSQCVFQIVVPLEFMQESPETKALLRHSPAAVVHMAPGRGIVSSPSFHHGVFDLQVIDWDYPLGVDPNPELITGRLYDMSYIRRRMRDHEPGVVKVVEKADSLWKWRLREVRGLPSWSSRKGRILLIGDASHGIVPHSGQGAAMGVEDGAVLAQLFSQASPQDDIKALVQLFEAIRRPRCDKVRTFATIQGEGWSTKDPKRVQHRRENIAVRQQTRTASTKPDQAASFFSPAFQMWLDKYDVEEEVRKAVQSASKSRQGKL